MSDDKSIPGNKTSASTPATGSPVPAPAKRGAGSFVTAAGTPRSVAAIAGGDDLRAQHHFPEPVAYDWESFPAQAPPPSVVPAKVSHGHGVATPSPTKEPPRVTFVQAPGHSVLQAIGYVAMFGLLGAFGGWLGAALGAHAAFSYGVGTGVGVLGGLCVARYELGGGRQPDEAKARERERVRRKKVEEFIKANLDLRPNAHPEQAGAQGKHIQRTDPAPVKKDPPTAERVSEAGRRRATEKATIDPERFLNIPDMDDDDEPARAEESSGWRTQVRDRILPDFARHLRPSTGLSRSHKELRQAIAEATTGKAANETAMVVMRMVAAAQEDPNRTVTGQDVRMFAAAAVVGRLEPRLALQAAMDEMCGTEFEPDYGAGIQAGLAASWIKSFVRNRSEDASFFEARCKRIEEAAQWAVEAAGDVERGAEDFFRLCDSYATIATAHHVARQDVGPPTRREIATFRNYSLWEDIVGGEIYDALRQAQLGDVRSERNIEGLDFLEHIDQAVRAFKEWRQAGARKDSDIRANFEPPRVLNVDNEAVASLVEQFVRNLVVTADALREA